MQTITIADTQAPVIVADVTIERPCDDYLGIYATATDNCSDHVSITYLGLIGGPEEVLSGTCAGQIVRTYIATDACGNAAEFFQIINLIDEVAPVCLNTPEAITIECGSQIPSYYPK